nr:hypothetical protein CFP56_62155 [Quercus suber]
MGSSSAGGGDHTPAKNSAASHHKDMGESKKGWMGGQGTGQQTCKSRGGLRVPQGPLLLASPCVCVLSQDVVVPTAAFRCVFIYLSLSHGAAFIAERGFNQTSQSRAYIPLDSTIFLTDRVFSSIISSSVRVSRLHGFVYPSTVRMMVRR